MFLNRKGFTLIELLVVIAIIGILAAMIVVSVSSYRAKARDTKRQADLKSIQTALYLFNNKFNKMPGNYNAGFGACEEQNPNPNAAYDKSMQELVDANFLSTIPRSPLGGTRRYCYFDYGQNNNKGAILETVLEVAQDTTTGIPPSCRPFKNADGPNWCTETNNKDYCLCTPY